MTVNRGPGVAKNGAVGVTTLEHRLQLAGQYAENAPGVPRSGVLTQATATLVAPRTDMSWDVGPCPAVIGRTPGEGVYTPTLTGTTNVPTIPAPATDSRWDLIYIKQNDPAKGDPDNEAIIGVVNGDAAASPAKPAVPPGGLVLAESRIFSGTTGTSGGSNTTAQVWRHTAARGAPIPVRNTTERAEITPANGQSVRRLDLRNRPEETWDGTAWTREGLRVQIGQGDNVPELKALEVAVALNAFSVGQITFPEPFPNKLVSVHLTRNHNAAGPLSFNTIAANTGKSSVEFVATGATSVANTTIYVYYEAWGY